MILDHKLQRMLNDSKIAQLNSERPLHQTAVMDILRIFEKSLFSRSRRSQSESLKNNFFLFSEVILSIFEKSLCSHFINDVFNHAFIAKQVNIQNTWLFVMSFDEALSEHDWNKNAANSPASDLTTHLQ